MKGDEREGIDDEKKSRGEERSVKERAMYNKERTREQDEIGTEESKE